jgi:hypothetical protein
MLKEIYHYQRRLMRQAGKHGCAEAICNYEITSTFEAYGYINSPIKIKGKSVPVTDLVRR